jgi:hypothetical protein
MDGFAEISELAVSLHSKLRGGKFSRNLGPEITPQKLKGDVAQTRRVAKDKKVKVNNP